jgi:hypothetical protein
MYTAFSRIIPPRVGGMVSVGECSAQVRSDDRHRSQSEVQYFHITRLLSKTK